MQAMEGDGSPWSYLSASALCREAAEFGAIWHGCVWSDQTILSKPPQQADGQDALHEPRALTSDAPVANWTWHGAVPRTWKPTYAEKATTREVVLHIHNPIGGETIYRATDTYPAGSYDGIKEGIGLMTLCSNVAQAGFLKEPAQSGGRSLQRPQMAQDVAPELRRRLQQALADPMRLQMIPDELIGLSSGEYGGKKNSRRRPLVDCTKSCTARARWVEC